MITAVGYGYHGYHADRLFLELIYGIQTLAGVHQCRRARRGAQAGASAIVYPAALIIQVTARPSTNATA